MKYLGESLMWVFIWLLVNPITLALLVLIGPTPVLSTVFGLSVLVVLFNLLGAVYAALTTDRR